MPNRLAGESSPYLLQHQHNPVDWYPWGDAAFARARTENKPIFLSIGYSACHWCHVMAHESFEDDETAAILNEHFVSVKVDREERPDVDHIYMNAVQAINGSGGWPMSVWLLPDGRPFFGGTYFPKEPRFRMPSFKSLLLRIAELYRSQPEALASDAANLTRSISRLAELDAQQGEAPKPELLEACFQSIAARYDSNFGGFGDAPKFPPGMTLELLLRLHHRFGWAHALEMVTFTLDRMMAGGIYDQLGGGFHRYSVDEAWLVPHFEKMLYDNAMLLRVYTYAYQETGQEHYRRVVSEIVAYLRREMTSPEGGFYSTQDADSEGEEGRYFIWDAAELRQLLEDLPNRDAVLAYWALDQGPNFEGRNILWVPRPLGDVAAAQGLSAEALEASVDAARARLFAAREKRTRPGRDEKILAGWNGLMIKSLAIAGRVFGLSDYEEMAKSAMSFVLDHMRQGDRLLRSYKDGHARFAAVLEDYALVIEALVELYECSYELQWYEEAMLLAETMVRRFWDEKHGFLDTAHDAEALIVRPQDLADGVMPSGSSSALNVLLRLSLLSGRTDWREMATRVLAALGPAIQSYPSAFSYLACAYDFAIAPNEIAMLGSQSTEEAQAMVNLLRGGFRPNQVTAWAESSHDPASERIPLLRGRAEGISGFTVYLCRNMVCQLPATGVEMLRQQLADNGPGVEGR